MEMTSFNWVGLWSEWLWPILQFIIGLGLVIFVHELGHFTVAKAVGIRVEQFALGFGPRLFGFKRGETDYRINIVPMGGYVKMTGQEDFGSLREGDERDPRSFSNKPIRARLAVISAGVVMNALLAAALFVIVCLAGIHFPAPVVGGTLIGSPAHDARIHWAGINHEGAGSSDSAPRRMSALQGVSIGLQPGDRILSVDGKRITQFAQLAATAALAEPDQDFRMMIEREVKDGFQSGYTNIGVMPLDGRLGFGLMPAMSTTFGSLGDYIADDPFRAGDRLLAINGQRIRHHWDIPSVEKVLNGQEATVKILRGQKEVDFRLQPTLRNKEGVFFLKEGDRVPGRILTYKGEEGVAVLRLPDGREKRVLLSNVVWPARDEILDILGLVPRLKISGVIRGSPAFQAGLKPGDIIVEYAGVPLPTIKNFLDINRELAEGVATIEVERKGRRLPPIEIHPKKHRGRIAVGIAVSIDQMNPVVAYVRAGSPAARAGIIRGDIFTKVNGKQAGNWIELFSTLSALHGQEITISFANSDPAEKKARIGALTPSVFDPQDYRFVLFPGPREFTILMGKAVKKNPVAAVLWGFRETWDFIAMTYATLADAFRGTVSYKEFSGPVGIGSVAIQAGREGITYFIYFMAVVSVSLAVLNFLPLPVVDGGYVVFLLIEKVRGKPLPLRVQNTIAMVGWAFLIAFFVLLTWNDIMRILSGLW
ncbi:MAG: site-2 protease family protein [Desulfobacterales bacterium]